MIAAALLLAAAASSPPIDDDVAHAALVFLDAEGTHAYGTRCLRVDGQDPSPALADRLRADLKDWVPGSACSEVAMADRRVRVHTRDGAPAEYLSISGFEANPDGSFSLGYEFWAGTFTGRGSTLRVEGRDGRWQVSRPGRYEWVE